MDAGGGGGLQRRLYVWQRSDVCRSRISLRRPGIDQRLSHLFFHGHTCGSWERIATMTLRLTLDKKPESSPTAESVSFRQPAPTLPTPVPRSSRHAGAEPPCSVGSGARSY